MILQTLFKKSSKGAEQQWTISVRDNGDNTASIITEHGQVGGQMQTAIVHVKQGKNLGKTNATTALSQAESEAKAKWLKQKDKGYSEERGGGSMELKPMLAHKYEDQKQKVDFATAFVQPKLDGVRALAYKEDEKTIRLISRQGKEHKGLDHIRAALLPLLNVGDVWDGELYIHGTPFQTLISLVKKDQEASKDIEYHVYDMVTDDSFVDRSFKIALTLDPEGTEAAKPHVIPDDRLVMVTTLSVWSHEDVERLHSEYVNAGYEGVMLRWGEEPYKSGYRSKHLLKVKSFQEEDFEIVDVVEGKGKFEGRAIFVCKTDEGATFEAVPRGRDELRQRYFQEKESLKGLKLIVRFFEWTSSTPPVPRFPVAIAPRDFE